MKKALLVSIALSLGMIQASAAVAQTTTQPAISEVSIKSGSFQKKRKALLKKIGQARESGVGIKPYLSAYMSLHLKLENGTGTPADEKRLESIARSLDEQIQRGKGLKNRTIPGPVSGSAIPTATAPVTGSAAEKSAPGAAGGKKADLGMLKQILRQHHPDKDIHNMSDDQLKKVIESNPKLGDLWKGLKGKQVVGGP